jgi:Arc/MetJ family transcription regulator
VRTTLTFDDELFAKAQEYTGIQERAALINEALRSLVQREAARRLALLGGSEPGFRLPPKKRPSMAKPRA